MDTIYSEISGGARVYWTYADEGSRVWISVAAAKEDIRRGARHVRTSSLMEEIKTETTQSLIDECDELALALDRYADRMDDCQQAADDDAELETTLIALAARAVTKDVQAVVYINGLIKSATIRQDKVALDRVASAVTAARACVKMATDCLA